MSFRVGISLIFVVLIATMCGGQAASSVGFNLNWYSTPRFPFNTIVGYPNCDVTTGVVIADFNRDGISDVAYSYPSCAGGGGALTLGGWRLVPRRLGSRLVQGRYLPVPRVTCTVEAPGWEALCNKKRDPPEIISKGPLFGK